MCLSYILLESEVLKLTQEQVLKTLKSGKHVFLTGKAGTGKTYVLNKYIKECEDEGKNIIIAAPTGIASLNFDITKSVGKTMHAAFKIPIPAYGKIYEDVNLSQIPKETKLADIIIIDEISMCRNDVFEYFSYVYRKICKELNKTIQVIVSGDFYQLPPVVKEDEKRKLKQFGLDPSGYCFLSPEWNRFKFKFCELTEIKRQDDKEFIENLGKLREGDTSCIKYFNKKVNADIKPDEDNTVICSMNYKADEINESFLSEIPGPRYAYACKKQGFTAKEYSVDEVILLKPGAKIIFMSNDNINQNYQNGTIGYVKECKDISIIVSANNKTFEVFPYEWKSYKITVSSGTINKKEIGNFTQLPVKLAYAVTMHKTQGQTYDKCIISPSSFAAGQLYVALSRVKTMDGLTLTEPIKRQDIKVSPIVKNFYINKKADIPEWIPAKKKEITEKRKKKQQKTKKTGGNKNVKRKSAKKNTVKRNTRKRVTRNKR